MNDLKEKICENECFWRKLTFTNKKITEKKSGARKLKFDKIKII